FLVGMLLTPPDIFSQTLLAIPMWFLFEIGVLFGSIIQKEREEKEAEESNPSASDDQTPSVKSWIYCCSITMIILQRIGYALLTAGCSTSIQSIKPAQGKPCA